MPLHAPADPPGTVYEFFGPFAHLEGRFEACRIRSPTHGVFDTFIVLGSDTSQPATVYVNSHAGRRFMAERYPQCTTVAVQRKDLGIDERRQGRTVEARLRSSTGPVRRAQLTFIAPSDQIPRNVAYGGMGRPVWGNPDLTCWGVDLVLDARVDGRIDLDDGAHLRLRREAGILTLGSFGRLAPRRAPEARTRTSCPNQVQGSPPRSGHRAPR